MWIGHYGQALSACFCFLEAARNLRAPLYKRTKRSEGRSKTFEMQDIVSAWLPFLLTYTLQAAFLLVVLVASVECMRSAWHQRRWEDQGPNRDVQRPAVGVGETSRGGDPSLSEAQLKMQQELAADDERKRKARRERMSAEVEDAERREAENAERLRLARESQQERQRAEAARKAEEARLKRLEELRVREQEVLQAKAARLDAPGGLHHPGQELEEARGKERELKSRQDAAFQAALAVDRARDAELKKIAEERERIEKGADALVERKRQERAAWEDQKRRLRESLLPEPPPGTAGRIALSVRLPNNSTFRRAWSPSSSLAEVYDWVNSLEEMSGQPEDYKLVTTFPRKVLSRAARDVDRTVILSELDIYPSAALVVELL